MRGFLVAALGVPAALALASCGGGGGTQTAGTTTTTAPKAFCETAHRYETELEHEATRGKLDRAKQLAIVERLVTTAPPSVRTDAQTFLDALRRVQQDPRLRDNPAVKRAVDNVNRYASNKCGFFNQQPQGI